MAMSLTRGASRTILALMLLLAIAVPAMAATPTSNTTNATGVSTRNTTLTTSTTTGVPITTPTAPETPYLIVWASTNLENQGAPTLDLVDIEHYFVTQLQCHGISGVVPSTTTTIPASAPANFYLLELSVEVMQVAHRAEREADGNSFQSLNVFHVQMSVRAKNLATGTLAGMATSQYDYRFRPYESTNDLSSKRGALYTVAANLAADFAVKTAAGQFGDALRAIHPPPPPPTAPTFWETYWSRLMAGDKAALGFTVTVVSAFFLVFLMIDTASTRRKDRRATQRAQAAQAWNEHHIAKEKERWDKELQDALTLKYETRNFSDAACLATAKAKREEWLKGAAEIQAKEAERQLKSKDLEVQYERVAAYAVSKCDLTRSDITNMLRAAAVWPYRVLQKAIEITEGAPYGK